jgi:hypothetical protein
MNILAVLRVVIIIAVVIVLWRVKRPPPANTSIMPLAIVNAPAATAPTRTTNPIRISSNAAGTLRH